MERDFKYLSTFHNKCLRNILKIFRLQIISNKQLFRTTGQDAMNNKLATRRWRRIGHVLRKTDDSISKTTQRWTHVVNKTWSTQTNVEEDSRKIIGTTTFELGGQAGKQAADKTKWRTLVSALCASGHEAD